MNLSFLHRIGFFHLSLDNIRSSEKFLSFYKEIMDAHFSFYIILSNYVWFILFYQDKDYNVRQIRFPVCTKMHCYKRCVRKRKTPFGQHNMSISVYWSISSFLQCYNTIEEAMIGAHTCIYSKGHHQKVSPVALAEGYKKQQ